MELKINRVKKLTLFFFVFLMLIVALICIFPYYLSMVISFTPIDTLNEIGYTVFPTDFSLETYKFVLSGWGEIGHAYLITIIVTLIGTLFVLLVTLTCGYVLSRSSFKYKTPLTIFIFITMIFNAGLTANYMIITQFLNINDSIWALILPLIVNPFWIFIARTYFKQVIPEAVLESAQIDGSSELKTFFVIVLPISKPVIATIGLFSTLAYWNDWIHAKLYIDDKTLYTLQYYLVKMQENIKYLKANAEQLGPDYLETIKNLPDDTIIMAVMIIATIPLVIAYPFFQKYFVSGLTVGSVK